LLDQFVCYGKMIFIGYLWLQRTGEEVQLESLVLAFP